MELRGSVSSGRRPPRRRPLGDVTNVVASSSSAEAFSYYPSVKLQSRPGPRRRPNLLGIPDETSVRFETSSTRSHNSGNPGSREGVPSASAAPAGETSANSVDVHQGNLEPSMINNLRSTKKRKIKGRAGGDVLQSSCPPAARIRSIGHNLKIKHEGIGRLGTCSVPHPKPKKKWHYTLSGNTSKRPISLPQEFIEKQKAYFAEIDAFELPEEEVSESELE